MSENKDLDFNNSSETAKEYRLIQVENSDTNHSNNSEIDLFDLFNSLWQNKSRFIKNAGIAAIIGVTFALITPKEFNTGASLIPEVGSQQSGASSLLSQYGGLFGVSGNFEPSLDGVIPPQLYPSIVKSLPFQLELINQEIKFSDYDTTMTSYDFFDNVYRGSVYSYAIKYSIGLPGVIRGWINGPGEVKPLPSGLVPDSMIAITFEQNEIIDSFKDRINISLSEETGIVRLSVEMPDPNASAEIAQLSIDLLKQYMIAYKTKKAQEDLDFAILQMEESKEKFTIAQNALADFQDNNINLATARAKTQRQRLESEYQLTFDLYNTLAQQVERAKLKVQEQTPVVSIINPVQVPVKKSKPKRSIMVLGFIFASVFISSLYYIALYILLKRKQLQTALE